MTETTKTTNVGDIERVLSALAGGTLVTWGFRRKSLGGLALAATGAELIRRGISGHCMLYQWLGRGAVQTGPVEVKSAITIDKPAGELYRVWCDPDTLSRVMGHFADVRPAAEKRLHWTAHGPAGTEVEWESEVTGQRKDEWVCWRSTGDALLPNDGEVFFRDDPQAHGTEVRLLMRFDPPGGTLGRAAIKALGPTPRLLAHRALQRFKSFAETGGIPPLQQPASTRPDDGVRGQQP